jgi:hypothetical protein
MTMEEKINKMRSNQSAFGKALLSSNKTETK